MRRILIRVAYDGTDYSGFQAQKDESIPTIEGKLREALQSLTGERAEIIGGSRTDAGVHAMDNVAVFDTESRIPAERFARALNTRLPEDIRAWSSREVEADFHPRRRRTVKTYEYRVWNAPYEDPMRRRYAEYDYGAFDIPRMREAAQFLVGEHDFKSFCNVHTQALSTVRKVLSVEVEEIPEASGRLIVIRVVGEGFLYNMVRIIAGTLLEVGRGKYPPEHVGEILEACDRSAAGFTAAARGLTLVRYEMGEEDGKGAPEGAENGNFVQKSVDSTPPEDI